MLEVGVPDEGSPCYFRIWESAPGIGTPLTWHMDDDVMWAYFGAQNPRSISQDVLSRNWLSKIFDHPELARQLTGVFALFAVNVKTGKLVVFNDRLGVQAIHYGQDSSGTWRISTNLTWLLLSLKHDGAVNDDGFLSHMGFGYSVEASEGVYRNIHTMPRSGCIRLSDSGLKHFSYWSPPATTQATSEQQIADAVLDLRQAIKAVAERDEVVLGLTAGKDSLCLASVLVKEDSTLLGTFGVPNSADQLQARQISAQLGIAHVSGGVCSPNEFPFWASHVSFQSAGLATSSYVDMAAFVGTHVPPGRIFIMGEGGECVRDFFQDGNGRPVETLTQRYMTQGNHLRHTLAPEYRKELQGYPRNLVAHAQSKAGLSDDGAFALHFYRYSRMPGNFSLRHAVLSSLRAKSSPFLDSRFIDGTYDLDLRWYENSRLHREIIASARPELLPFFESPVSSKHTVQEWAGRFVNGIGAATYELLDQALPWCEDVFSGDGVRKLCHENMRQPGRAVYHLFRVLSFALARQLLRTESSERLARIPQITLKIRDRIPEAELSRA